MEARDAGQVGVDSWAVLNALGSGIAVLDSSGEVLWTNAALRRLDLDQQLEVGATLSEVAYAFAASAEEGHRLATAVDEVLHGRSQHLEVECRMGEFVFAIAVEPSHVTYGRGAILTIRDVTAHHNAEAWVRESEARWRRLVDGSPDIVFLTDATSRMIYANGALEERCGYTAADFQMPQAENRFLHPDDQARVAGFIAEFVKSDRVYSDRIENRFITRGGEEMWCSSVISKTQYAGQPALQFVVHDVSAEKRAISETERLLQEAESAVRARDEFLRLAAHELKTPLTSLRGFAEWLSTGDTHDPERRKRAIEAIARQVVRLGRLVDRLLDVTRLEGGVLEIEPSRVDLADVVRVAVEAASFAGAAVTVEGPETCPAVVDSFRIEQVIVNLVDNALRHGPPTGPVRVSLSLGRGERPTDSTGRRPTIAAIEVSDLGPGIPPEERERIFGRFYRGTEVRKSGLGLGLHLASEIARLHGGALTLVDQPVGTCFRLTLPIDPGD